MKNDRSYEECDAWRAERLQEEHNIRAEEEKITAARTKQHEDKEEDTGIRPAGGGVGEQRDKQSKNNKTSKESAIATASALSPLNSTKTDRNYYSL